MPSYAVPSTSTHREVNALAGIIARVLSEAQGSSTRASAALTALVDIDIHASDDAAAIGSNTAPTTDISTLAARLEFFRIHNPDLYEAMSAALHFDEPFTFRCKPTRSGMYKGAIAVLIFIIMFFEYFFSAQAQIKDDAALATSCSTVSVTLNTALTTFVLNAFFLALYLNFTGFFAQISQAPDARSAIALVPKMIDRNLLPYAWSSRGRADFREYGISNATYYLEALIKTPLVLALQAEGLISAYLIAALLFENSEKAFFAAFEQYEWLLLFFSVAAYASFWIYANYGQIVTTTLLTGLEHIEQIGALLHSNPSTLASKRRLLDFMQALNVLSNNFEMPSAAAKMRYIRGNLSHAQKKILQGRTAAWIEGLELIPGSSIDEAEKNRIEETLNVECSTMLQHILSNFFFKAAFLLAFLFSIAATIAYCIGIRDNLFPGAIDNPNLPASTVALFKFLRADTPTGALVVAFFAVGVFATTYGSYGLTNIFRDSFIRMAHQKGYAHILKVFAAFVITAGLAAFSGATAAFEASAGKFNIFAFFGGAKGASVNGIGAHVLTLALVLIAERILSGLTTLARASCPSSNTRRSCLSFARTDASERAARRPLLLTNGVPQRAYS